MQFHRVIELIYERVMLKIISEEQLSKNEKVHYVEDKPLSGEQYIENYGGLLDAQGHEWPSYLTTADVKKLISTIRGLDISSEDEDDLMRVEAAMTARNSIENSLEKFSSMTNGEEKLYKALHSFVFTVKSYIDPILERRGFAKSRDSTSPLNAGVEQMSSIALGCVEWIGNTYGSDDDLPISDHASMFVVSPMHRLIVAALTSIQIDVETKMNIDEDQKLFNDWITGSNQSRYGLTDDEKTMIMSYIDKTHVDIDFRKLENTFCLSDSDKKEQLFSLRTISYAVSHGTYEMSNIQPGGSLINIVRHLILHGVDNSVKKSAYELLVNLKEKHPNIIRMLKPKLT